MMNFKNIIMFLKSYNGLFFYCCTVFLFNKIRILINKKLFLFAKNMIANILYLLVV